MTFFKLHKLVLQKNISFRVYTIDLSTLYFLVFQIAKHSSTALLWIHHIQVSLRILPYLNIGYKPVEIPTRHHSKSEPFAKVNHSDT